MSHHRWHHHQSLISTSVSLITITIFVCSSFFVSPSQCHVFRVGDCPKVEVMNNFSMKKFLGPWYVIQKFRTSSNCFIENVTTSHDEYFITERMKPLGVQMHQKGKVSFVDGQPESVMKVSYPVTSPLGDQNYWIIDTDYDSYAAVWSCQRLPMLGHRESAQIMSRKPVLDMGIVRRLRKRFEEFGIDEHYFSVIDQSSCHWDDEGNVRRGDNGSNDNSEDDEDLSFRFGPIRFSNKMASSSSAADLKLDSSVPETPETVK